MDISGKITAVVDGSNGRLHHFDGKAGEEACQLIVQEKKEGVYALVSPKKPASKIGAKRVITYQGNILAEGKGKNPSLKFSGVFAHLRVMPQEAQKEQAGALSEAQEQNRQMKSFIDQMMPLLEKAGLKPDQEENAKG